jgi:hypothetical protein
VFFGAGHRLEYAQDANGNRILDFSHAGYGGGGVPLPSLPVRATVSPSGGDDTAAIQAAIDAVAALPLDSDGFRGAVLLAPGAYTVSSTLQIVASGVVLRGSGSGDGGTVLTMVGPPFLFLRMSGSGSWSTSGSTAITDSYVPSGAKSFTVADGSGFSVGDPVLITRPVTAAWVHFMDMDTLVRNGQPQVWLAPGSTITTDRLVAAIDGNRITLDVPLTDSFDAQFLNPPGSTIAKYTFAGRISQVGAEDFAVIAPAIDAIQYSGLSMSAALDAWVRGVVFQDTQNTVTLSTSVKRATLQDVHVQHTVRQSNSGAPVDFALSATQVLLDKATVTGNGNTWPAVTHSRTTGPVVVLNMFADDRGFAPHQRWGTGMLCDNCNFPNSHTGDKTGIAYSNRGFFGSGHGWDAGWGVAWNVTSTFFLVQQPPGVQNFCIGCIGTITTQARPGNSSPLLPNGIYDSFGVPVTPSSLYLQQLLERRGPRAVIDIGYLDYLKSIDSIAPVTSAAFSPAANGSGWNNSDVTVTLTSSDDPPGEGVGPRDVTYSTSGAQTSGNVVVPGASASFTIGTEGTTTITFSGTDFAENAEAPRTAVLMLDKTAPAIQGSASPAANANGWNNSDVTVRFACSDALSGLAAGSPPPATVLSAEGVGAQVDGSCQDVASNLASATVGGINIDKTAPEAFQQWDPVTKDVLLFGRDALSGTAAGPIPPSSVVVSNDDDDDNDDDDSARGPLDRDHDHDPHTVELRTYTVLDLAGNPLVLVEEVRRREHSVTVHVVSLQSLGGPVVPLPRNTQKIEWKTRRDGRLREVEQRFEVGPERNEQEISADFDAERNQTVIRDESRHRRIVKPGLVLLQMATQDGGLVIQF